MYEAERLHSDRMALTLLEHNAARKHRTHEAGAFRGILFGGEAFGGEAF